jgi:hypothetical protein
MFLGFNSLAADVLKPNAVVLNYFQALKQGDIETIKKYIMGEFYNKKKILLEENNKYPEFLRRHYKNVTVRIIDTNIEDREATVVVGIRFPNGKENYLEMNLKQTSQNSWKIFREKFVV